MRSPAAAIVWQLLRRNRWGLIGVIAYFVVVSAIRLLIFAPGQRVAFDDAEAFALSVVVPQTATFIYFLALFSFGLDGDLASRQSMYPARMFTLPVTTSALAAW